MSEVYGSDRVHRTCLIRGREGEGRFGLLRKGPSVSKVLPVGMEGAGEWVDTSLMYDERIAPLGVRAAAARDVDTDLVYEERVAPRPAHTPNKSMGADSINVLVGMLVVRNLLNEVHKVALAVERGVEEHEAVINNDPALLDRVQAVLERVGKKVIAWSQDLLVGKVPALLKKPKRGTGPLAHSAFHDSVNEILIVNLRKLTAVELKKVLPPEMFQSVLDRAVEELDEPGR
jgi:hypothetical protein